MRIVCSVYHEHGKGVSGMRNISLHLRWRSLFQSCSWFSELCAVKIVRIVTSFAGVVIYRCVGQLNLLLPGVFRDFYTSTQTEVPKLCQRVCCSLYTTGKRVVYEAYNECQFTSGNVKPLLEVRQTYQATVCIEKEMRQLLCIWYQPTIAKWDKTVKH